MYAAATVSTRTILAESDAPLMKRLQAFGLIESNGAGGWRMTECCEAALAQDRQNTEICTPVAPAAVVRPWRPRTL